MCSKLYFEFVYVFKICIKQIGEFSENPREIQICGV